MTDNEHPRSSRLASVAYVGLGIALVTGLWSRLPDKKPRPDRIFQAESYSDVFGGPPAPKPLTVNPSAPRVVSWCRVRQVIESRCQRCHGSPTSLGAPFSLVTYADTQRDHPARTGESISARMAHVIRYQVMPPMTLPLDPPVTPLSELEKDLLLAWLEEGALAFGGEDCANRAGGPTPGLRPVQ